MKNIIFTAVLIFTSNLFYSQDSFIDDNLETSTKSIILESSDLYTVTPTNINSNLSDIGSTFFKDRYIIYSSRRTGAIGAGKDENTKNPYQQLYCISVDAKGNLSKPGFFGYSLNSKGNEEGVTFSPDEKTVYVSKSEANNTKNYQLYKLTFDGSHSWKDQVAIAFNNTSYSIENPCMASDGKKMYFSSNMPGGQGGFDLYVADINKDGMPVNPVNLGKDINTNEDEKFPYVTKSNKEIYFSSNGHNGYGSQDVFVSKIKANRYTTPLNLGKTINTSSDEVAFILSNNNRGFVSSNRSEKTSFDVYKFEVQKAANKLEGTVTEKLSKIALPNTKISLVNEDGKEVATQTSDENGKFKFDLDASDSYTVLAKKDGYVDFDSKVTVDGNSISNVELNQKKAEVTEKAIVIENIYFDYNLAKIKQESTLSLNKILEVLNGNPEMRIAINAHTDSRGSDKYNMVLSEKRAFEAKQYLISKGISEDRLESIGFGETKSLSDCKSKKCSETQFEADRRVEFIIK
jgi:outer membrane protein OmpA-like peptidoglycan-associated protein